MLLAPLVWLAALDRDALGWEAGVSGTGLYPHWDLGSPVDTWAEFKSKA